jgi:hypothetical protein
MLNDMSWTDRLHDFGFLRQPSATVDPFMIADKASLALHHHMTPADQEDDGEDEQTPRSSVVSYS